MLVEAETFGYQHPSSQFDIPGFFSHSPMAAHPGQLGSSAWTNRLAKRKEQRVRSIMVALRSNDNDRVILGKNENDIGHTTEVGRKPSQPNPFSYVVVGTHHNHRATMEFLLLWKE